MRVSSSGGCTSVIRPHSNRVLSRSSRVASCFGRPVGRDDDLLVGVVQRVEGVEELFLDTFLAFDELDVIDEQHVDVAVAALERDLAVVAQRVDEVVGEFLGGDVLDPHAGEQSLRVIAGGVQQVGLAEAGLAPDEERVVGAGRCFGDRQGRGVREAVGGADDEGVEGVATVEAGSAGDGRVGGVRTFGEVVGPALFGAARDITVFVGLVGVDRRVQVGVVGLVQGWSELARRPREGEGIRVGVVGGWGDAHPELDLLPEPAAERVGDGGAQMTFDLVLHKAARHRQQSKPLDDGERLDEIQPRPLLGCQRSDESGAIGGDAVRSGLAVELGDDRVPHCGET